MKGPTRMPISHPLRRRLTANDSIAGLVRRACIVMTWQGNRYGAVIWVKPTLERAWGKACSPVIHQNKLVIVRDNARQSSIEVLDAKTGETVWKKNRDEPNAWATPCVVQHQGQTQIIHGSLQQNPQLQSRQRKHYLAMRRTYRKRQSMPCHRRSFGLLHERVRGLFADGIAIGCGRRRYQLGNHTLEKKPGNALRSLHPYSTTESFISRSPIRAS